MDKTAFFKLTYGLFIAAAEYNGKSNGCIINTAVQTTSEPATMSATMLKTNLTTEMIVQKRNMTISVLSSDCPLDMIKHFGMNSGRTIDKFAALHYRRDDNNNPYIIEGALASFSCEVRDIIDMGTHFMFILDVKDSQTFNDPSEPLTYAAYRTMKNAAATNNSDHHTPTWVCSVCHYVYDGKIPFEELPEEWVCPVCGKPKSVFVKELK